MRACTVAAVRLALGLALACGVLAAALPAGVALAAPQPPSCAVTLDEHTQTAKPTATGAYTLVFSGSINATMGGLSGSRDMTIGAVFSPSTWGAQVDPPSSNITGTVRVFFNATVTVPPAEDAATRGSLSIEASFLAVQGFPGSAVQCSDTATIPVAQYYGVDGDAISSLTVTSGPTGSVGTFIVRNLGNGHDTFTVDLEPENRPYLESAGIHTNLPLEHVALSANSQGNFTFLVNATSDAKPDSYDMHLTVHSDTVPTAKDLVPITLVVKSGAILANLPDFTTVLIIAAVVASLLTAALLRRGQKRRKAAREARRQLQKVLRQRREGERAAPEGAVPPQEDAVGAFEAAQAPEPARVRVRVKVPPKV